MPHDSIKVLSIRQPYADFVFHLGKWCENRSWRTNYRGPLYVHASKLDASEVAAWRAKGINLREHIPMVTGAIIGRVNLVDCVHADDIHRFAPKRFRKEWLFGKVDGRKGVPAHLHAVRDFLKTVDAESWQHVAWDDFGWILTQPMLLAKPVPAKGRLSVWQHPWDPRFDAFSTAQ